MLAWNSHLIPTTNNYQQAKGDLEFPIPLYPPPEFWGYRCLPPCPAGLYFLNNSATILCDKAFAGETQHMATLSSQGAHNRPKYGYLRSRTC